MGEDGAILFLVDPGAGEPGKGEVRIKGTADEVESALLPGWKLGVLFLPEEPERPPEGLVVRREQVEFLRVELGVDPAVEDIDVGGHRRADRGVQVEIVHRLDVLVAGQRAKRDSVAELVLEVEHRARRLVGVGKVGILLDGAQRLLAKNGRWIAAEIEVVVVDLERRGETVRRLPEQTQSVTVVVYFAGMAGVVPDDGIVEVIALVVPVGQPQSCGFAHGDVDDTGCLVGRVVTCSQLDAPVKLSELGVVGVDEHGAARGVLADESSLRAAIDFDRLHVEIGLVLEIAGKCRRAIAIDHDTRWDVDVDLATAQTADVEHVRRAVLSDGDRRCRVLQGEQIRDALVFEQVLVQHRGGNAGRLQVLAATLRGHDDFFEPGARLRLRACAWPSGLTSAAEQAIASSGKRFRSEIAFLI